VISFRTKSDTATSVAILVSLAILVVTGLVMLFVPKPTTDGLARGKVRSERELEDRLKKLKADKVKLATQIVTHTWPLKMEEIGPKGLESINAFAGKHRLKLMAFRPQKPLEVNNLTQLPFLISIEGPYPAIMRFVKELENPSLKLGTNLVQISGSDPNSDLVSATIGVVAYKQIEIKKPQGKTNAAKKEN
jgi:Tfp pilus assembly protein PilO